MASSNIDPSQISIIVKDAHGEKQKISDASFSVDSDERGGKIIILRSSSGRRAHEFMLTECNHIEESSLRGRVEYFQVPSRNIGVLIRAHNERAEKQLDNLYKALTEGSNRTLSSMPIDEVIEKFLDAVENGDCSSAQNYARELAQQKVEVPLIFDMTKHLQNTQELASTAEKLFHVKICIESLFTMEKPEEIFEVSIAAHTTIGQLKRLIELETGIPSERQNWFIDRHCLSDQYAFGDDLPSVNEKTLVYLSIVTPLSS